ncbi:MAG: hypothetical protein FD153_1754 [Rhodospirillaceae bacterium]|nr:MAG: hypothetical protein FD153_1754 [Rhodospirillaceae bacterium]
MHTSFLISDGPERSIESMHIRRLVKPGKAGGLLELFILRHSRGNLSSHRWGRESMFTSLSRMPACAGITIFRNVRIKKGFASHLLARGQDLRAPGSL